MNLYIVRHAIAEQQPANGSQDDSQRALTDQGRRKFRKAARGLKETGVQIDLILTSPYLRAAETARILRKQLELDKEQMITVDELAPGGDASRLMNDITQKYAVVENIALVGHEPGLSRLISTLISGDPSIPITLKKGGVCCLSAQRLAYGRCATLEWLMAPAELTSLRD